MWINANALFADPFGTRRLSFFFANISYKYFFKNLLRWLGRESSRLSTLWSKDIFCFASWTSQVGPRVLPGCDGPLEMKGERKRKRDQAKCITYRMYRESDNIKSVNVNPREIRCRAVAELDLSFCSPFSIAREAASRLSYRETRSDTIKESLVGHSLSMLSCCGYRIVLFLSVCHFELFQRPDIFPCRRRETTWRKYLCHAEGIKVLFGKNG